SFWKRSLKTNLLLIFITRVGLPALASSLVFVTLDHIDLISPTKKYAPINLWALINEASCNLLLCTSFS
ncbi:hypothetical protein JQC92_09195, partial [Shewanella sp. 202IG2-18]|uniref:hypothetical protein n=1 Tax=Parashewanella hymeniacidonis TaxID=2807618 RepID=UPI0019601B3E